MKEKIFVLACRDVTNSTIFNSTTVKKLRNIIILTHIIRGLVDLYPISLISFIQSIGFFIGIMF